MRASESRTSRISPRVLLNSGDSIKAFFVTAFCACTQSSAFAPWMSSSHRYGSSDAALVVDAPDAEAGFAIAMPVIVTPKAKTAQMVFMLAVPQSFPATGCRLRPGSSAWDESHAAETKSPARAGLFVEQDQPKISGSP